MLRASLIMPFYFQTIIGDFRREQDKFMTENRDKKKQSEAAVPPWVGYNEEEAMKKQILSLSTVCGPFFHIKP